MCNIWHFGDIENFFKFVDLKKQLTIGLVAVGTYYLVCGLLHNAGVCLCGNMSSDYFGWQPPKQDKNILLEQNRLTYITCNKKYQ